MRTITVITVLAAVLLIPLSAATAQSAPDTCWVEGYLWTPQLKPAKRITLEIRRAERTGYLFSWGSADPQPRTDSTGFIRFPAPRNSVLWVYADAPPFNRDQVNGTRISIPNTPTARLETISPAGSPPALHLVAVPPQRYRVTKDGILKADTIHTLDVEGEGVTVTNPSSGTARVSFTGGSSAAYGDSIRVADSLAHAALDSVRDAQLRLFAAEALAQTAMDSASRARLDALAALALAGLARDTAALATLRALAALALAQTALDTASRARLDLITVNTIATAAHDTASLATLRALVAQGMASSALAAAQTALDSASRARLDLASHTARIDNPHQVTAAQIGALTGEVDPVFMAAQPSLQTKDDTTRNLRQTHPELPNLTQILTADSNKTICVDNSGRLFLCWKGSGAAVMDTSLFVGMNRDDLNIQGRKVFKADSAAGFVVTKTDLRPNSSTAFSVKHNDTTLFRIERYTAGAYGNIHRGITRWIFPQSGNYTQDEMRVGDITLVANYGYGAGISAGSQLSISAGHDMSIGYRNASLYSSNASSAMQIYNSSTTKRALHFDSRTVGLGGYANGTRGTTIYGKTVFPDSGIEIQNGGVTATNGTGAFKAIDTDSVMLGGTGIVRDTIVRADTMYIQQLEHWLPVALDRDYSAASPPRKIGTIEYRMAMASTGVYECTLAADSANGVRIQGVRFEGASHGYGQMLGTRYTTLIQTASDGAWVNMANSNTGGSYPLTGSAYIHPGSSNTTETKRIDMRLWISNGGRASGKMIVDYIILGGGASAHPIRLINF